MSNIRVIEKIGREQGKTAVILAGVHGNELSGVSAFDELIPSLEIKSGKVIFIYANLEAIKQDKRFVEFNLNRCFFPVQPKEISGTLEGKTAKEIMPYLDNADFLLDLHASNSPNSMPFVISDENSIELARFLPCEVISLGWDRFEKGSTEFFMHLNKKKGICFEAGYINDTKSIEISKKAIIGFLAGLGFIEEENTEGLERKYFKIISIYRNRNAKFKKSREFADFEILKEDTLIGWDGNRDVRVKSGFAVVFVRDRDEFNGECFLVAEVLDKIS